MSPSASPSSSRWCAYYSSTFRAFPNAKLPSMEMRTDENLTLPISPNPLSSSSRQRVSSSSETVVPPKPLTKTRRRTKANPPRPSNCFILFRSDFSRRNRYNPDVDTKILSSLAGTAWRSISPEEKAKWVQLAAEEKNRHQVWYPGYKYKPNPSAKRKRQTVQTAQDLNCHACSLPLPQDGSACPGCTRSHNELPDASLLTTPQLTFDNSLPSPPSNPLTSYSAPLSSSSQTFFGRVTDFHILPVDALYTLSAPSQAGIGTAPDLRLPDSESWTEFLNESFL